MIDYMELLKMHIILNRRRRRCNLIVSKLIQKEKYLKNWMKKLLEFWQGQMSLYLWRMYY